MSTVFSCHSSIFLLPIHSMLSKHRSLHLDFVGPSPIIERLYGGRHRMTFLCKPVNPTTDWWQANKAKIFADFDTLATDTFGSASQTAPEGVHYAHMRLISADLNEEGLIPFVYETLTDTWTKEREDQIGAERNGLRTVSRSLVARPGTAKPYNEGDVGSATISSNGKTLYLGGFQDQSTDRIGRWESSWMEPGVLARDEAQGPAPGTVDTILTAFAVVPTAPADSVLTRKRQREFEGIKTYDYHFTTGIGEGNKFSYQRTVEIVDPGTVELRVAEFTAVHTFLYESILDGGAPNQQGFIRVVGTPVIAETDENGDPIDPTVTGIDGIENRVIGQVAITRSIRASRKPVTATVSEWITDSPPNPTTPYANNLAGYGVWLTETTINQRGGRSNVRKSSTYLPQVRLVGAASVAATWYSTIFAANTDKKTYSSRTAITAEQVGDAPEAGGLYEVTPTYVFTDLSTGTKYFLVREIRLNS